MSDCPHLSSAVQQFAEHFHRSPEQLGPEHLRQYQLYLLREKKLAASTVEVRISALRFLYKRILKRRDVGFDDLPFPMTPHTLPTMLSPEEVTRLIDAAPNRMHRTMLMLLYATGVRRSEASLLEVADIDSEHMVVHVRQGILGLLNHSHSDNETYFIWAVLILWSAPALAGAIWGIKSSSNQSAQD